MPTRKVVFRVDGACRNNDLPARYRYAAAACCLILGPGRQYTRTVRLPDHPTPTDNRAELMAVTMALRWALRVWAGLDRSISSPRFEVEVQSDSRYSIGAMTQWQSGWRERGWTSSAGKPVANRDLIEEAERYNVEIRKVGTITYKWIPREQNSAADWVVIMN